MYRIVNQPYHTGQIVRANFPALNSLKWFIAMRYKKGKEAHFRLIYVWLLLRMDNQCCLLYICTSLGWTDTDWPTYESRLRRCAFMSVRVWTCSLLTSFTEELIEYVMSWRGWSTDSHTNHPRHSSHHQIQKGRCNFHLQTVIGAACARQSTDGVKTNPCVL